MGHKNIQMTMRYAHLAEDTKKEAIKVASMSPEKIAKAFQHFAYEMDPRLHLSRAAEWLSGKEKVEKAG